MNKTLVRRLNQLNQEFYKQVTTSFSESRSYYWQGWNKLVPYIQELADKNKNKVTVLDVGCGNGRFGAFLAEQLPDVQIKYLGVDNSHGLLEIARQQKLSSNIKTNFLRLDLIKLLLNDAFKQELKDLKPNFVTALGLLHHVPSYELRQKFIIELAEILSQPGYLAFTTWNFLNTKRFHKKIVDPAKVDLDPKNLEKHDVILDWKRGEMAYRYCHHTDLEELQALIDKSKLELISQFEADGKSSRLNTYSVLKK